MFTPGIQPDYLPQSIIDLIDVIGLQDALTLVEQRGGAWIDVPVKAKPDSALVQHIGFESLQKLVRVYQGTRVEIPRCHAALKAMQEEEIISAAQAGESNVSLALRFGYTDRGIRKLRRRVNARQGIKSAQQELF